MIAIENPYWPSSGIDELTATVVVADKDMAR
jgi:hypothetical protein